MKGPAVVRWCSKAFRLKIALIFVADVKGLSKVRFPGVSALPIFHLDAGKTKLPLSHISRTFCIV